MNPIHTLLSSLPTRVPNLWSLVLVLPILLNGNLAIALASLLQHSAFTFPVLQSLNFFVRDNRICGCSFAARHQRISHLRYDDRARHSMSSALCVAENAFPNLEYFQGSYTNALVLLESSGTRPLGSADLILHMRENVGLSEAVHKLAQCKTLHSLSLSNVDRLGRDVTLLMKFHNLKILSFVNSQLCLFLH
jgi:hypothetical protein